MFQFPANPVVGQQFAPAAGITYEWNGTGWVQLGLTTASLYPAGVVLPYAGNSPLPFQGWLLCDGSLVAQATYPVLFAVIGNLYGGAAPNFNLPDLRGRAIFGRSSMGGPSSGRITVAGSNINGDAMAAVGGAESVVLTQAQLATHTHAVSDPTHNHGISDPGHAHGFNASVTNYGPRGGVGGEFWGGPVSAGATAAAGTGVTNQPSGTGIAIFNAGNDVAHLNMPPAMIMNYIIKI